MKWILSLFLAFAAIIGLSGTASAQNTSADKPTLINDTSSNYDMLIIYDIEYGEDEYKADFRAFNIGDEAIIEIGSEPVSGQTVKYVYLIRKNSETLPYLKRFRAKNGSLTLTQPQLADALAELDVAYSYSSYSLYLVLEKRGFLDKPAYIKVQDKGEMEVGYR